MFFVLWASCLVIVLFSFGSSQALRLDRSINSTLSTSQSKSTPGKMTPGEASKRMIQDDVDVDDETSSSGSSSDGDDDFEEDQESYQSGGNSKDNLEEVKATSPSRQTSKFSTKPTLGQTSDLQSRLQAFLPKLEKANAELENTDDIKQRRIDDVAEDDEHYIEMNLQLGVLSERKTGDRDGKLKFRESGSEGEDEDDDDDDDVDASIDQGVISTLKGEKARDRQNGRIQEIGPDAGRRDEDGDHT